MNALLSLPGKALVQFISTRPVVYNNPAELHRRRLKDLVRMLWLIPWFPQVLAFKILFMVGEWWKMMINACQEIL